MILSIHSAQNGTETEILLKKYDFYSVNYKDIKSPEGEMSRYPISIKINTVKFTDKIKEMGYCRYDINKIPFLLKIKDNTAEVVDITNIQDEFMEYLAQMPDIMPGEESKEMVKNKVLDNLDKLFKKNLLYTIKNDSKIEFLEDTKDESFTFYKNCVVRVTKDGIDTLDYKKITKLVWKENILNRNFSIIKEVDLPKGNFYKFCRNVANGKEQKYDRLNALKSIIGYCLHKHYEGKLKAIVFTDSRMSEKADGRSGKTMICQFIGHMMNASKVGDKIYCEINGKTFDKNSPTRYQEANINTKLINLNDVEHHGNFRFDMETIFNDITEGAKVKRLYCEPFIINVKYIITTNKTLKVDGGSAKDRVLEYELSDYYSEKFSPFQEFGQWFLRDWNDLEFSYFDNFMLRSVQFYLKNGLQKPESINLEARKLKEQTAPEFIEFMDELGAKKGMEIAKGDAYTEFTNQYIDFRGKLSQRKFTDWLRQYTIQCKELVSWSDDTKQKIEIRAKHEGKNIDKFVFIVEK